MHVLNVRPIDSICGALSAADGSYSGPSLQQLQILLEQAMRQPGLRAQLDWWSLLALRITVEYDHYFATATWRFYAGKSEKKTLLWTLVGPCAATIYGVIVNECTKDNI